MDYYPNHDHAAGRRHQRNVKEVRKDARTEIARELACMVQLLAVNDESSRRGVEDALKRLHTLDTYFSNSQRNQLEKLKAEFKSTTHESH